MRKDRFDIIPDETAWTIFDHVTGKPAQIDGVPQTGLTLDDADDLLDLLYLIEEQADGATHH